MIKFTALFFISTESLKTIKYQTFSKKTVLFCYWQQVGEWRWKSIETIRITWVIKSSWFKSNFTYNGREIAFAGKRSLSFGNGFPRNVVIFGW